MRVILHNLCQIQHAWFSLRYVDCGPRHIQCSCNSAYSGFNIRLNISALLLEISRQFNACYTRNLVPNTAHILQFSLCEQWSRIYTMHLQLCIFSAAIWNWTYLRCNCRYHDNWMHVILQTWCHIQRTSSSFRYVNSNPGHIQCICSSAYSDFNIHLNASALLSEICWYLDARYTVILVRNTARILRFKLCEQ
jgi:hypothetical protein